MDMETSNIFDRTEETSNIFNHTETPSGDSQSFLDDDFDNDMLLLILTLAMAFLSLSCYLLCDKWAKQRQLEQYLLVQHNGLPVLGTLTFSGASTRVNNTPLFHTRATYRYRVQVDDGEVQEVSKKAVVLGTYEPAQGAVEIVEMVVLPGYPRSGVEMSTPKDISESISKNLTRRIQHVIVCLIIAVVLWVWGFIKATTDQDMLAFWISIGLTAFMAPIEMVIASMVMRTQFHRTFLEPTKNVTITEVSHDGDRLLRPARMSCHVVKQKRRERRPLLQKTPSSGRDILNLVV